jgi:hypothetical protein
MSTDLLTDRFSDQIAGVLNCYDRLIIQRTKPDLCHAQAMTTYLNVRHIRILDYAQFAQPLRERLSKHAEAIAVEHGIEIEFIRKSSLRKSEKIQAVIQERGAQPGLVAILSAMEPCSSYKPWHDKQTGKTFLRPDAGKCLHFYFYFIDEQLGLCYLRVPTWCPFRLQFYCNGHLWLAAELIKRKIRYRLADNAFASIANLALAQKTADGMRVQTLHRKLDAFVRRYCPAIAELSVTYHWSIDQAEYATDIIFRRQADLQAIYDHLTRTAIHTVKPENVATFLGRKLHGNYQDELGNRFDTRIAGTRIRHTVGSASIKMYDKHGFILRIETTVNDVSFFKHYRRVEHRDGTTETKWTSMKKGIYSLPALAEVLCAANRRYSEFISAIDTPTAGVDALRKISAGLREGEHTYPGFTSSPVRISNSWRRWSAESTASAASRTNPYANASPTKPARKYPVRLSVCAFTGSSRRLATPTTITSPSSAESLRARAQDQRAHPHPATRRRSRLT